MGRPRLDPELGVVASAKKDDDLYMKSRKTPKSSAGWRSRSASRFPPRKTLKRLGVLLLVAAAIYVFIHNIPDDLGPQDRRRPVYITPSNSGPFPPGVRDPSSGRELDEEKPVFLARGDYDGPLRFLELAESLHAISGTKGTQQLNKNVLFMAGSIRSADILLPIACQMGKELRSYVHFALLSRDEMPLQQLQEINGIDDSCNVIFHDARPDLASRSTDDRYFKTVERALFHINSYMHPQAVLVDGSDAEEHSFMPALKKQAAKMNLQASIIELPAHAEENLSWIAKLDAASLLQWSKIGIEILVHAHAGASGSLIRLLKSLSVADFGACAVPHLTIELPEDLDASTAQWIQDFQWPPTNGHEPHTASQLTLRRRISRRGLTEEESSVRFLESFWPQNYLFSHVLVLSPQAELSPNFFHYLKMSILEYRYSTYAISSGANQRLFSISLDLPTTNLEGTSRVDKPSRLRTAAQSSKTTATDDSTLFLWQAPNSNAALFMGDKWVELYNFVTQVLDIQHKSGSSTTPALLAEKSVSRDYPAWMEHALRICQALGYWTIYPSTMLASNLATIHTDLYRQPEEYENTNSRSGASRKHGFGNKNNDDDDDEIVIRREDLLNSLPLNDGSLLRFDEMPLLAWDGTLTDLEHLDAAALKYATQFRRTVGGCEDKGEEPTAPRSLFCTGDTGI